jgi:hypothetical protein
MDTDQTSDWPTWWNGRGREGLRELLLRRWDPIGAADLGADDEYDDYLDPVGRLLREEATADQIAAYLRSVRLDVMGPQPEPLQRAGG